MLPPPKIRVFTIPPETSCIFQPFQHPQTLPSAHTLYICVLCGSQNKQRLFPYTALTDWFL